MAFQEVGWSVDWIDLAQDRDRYWAGFIWLRIETGGGLD